MTDIDDISGIFYVELLFYIQKSTGPIETNLIFKAVNLLNYNINSMIELIVVSYFVCDADLVGFSGNFLSCSSSPCEQNAQKIFSRKTKFPPFFSESIFS